MKILIVEDDENSRVLLESLLEVNGYEVESAENGKVALALASRKPPDLIISDILMPEMDGFALCRAVKADEQLRDIPFIFYTATYTDSRDEKLCMDLGAARFIIKPMEIDALLAEIKTILEDQKKDKLPASQQLLKSEQELQKDYAVVLAKKLDQKVRQLEEERKKLQESEQKYRSLVEALRDDYFFYTHSPDGVFVYISPSITSVLGYSQEEFFVHYTEYLTDNPINKDVVRHTDLAIKGEEQSSYEAEIYHKDGSIRSLELTEKPILDESGKIVAVEGIAHDITQRKQAEEGLQKQTYVLKKRVKELNCLYSISKLLEEQDISLEEIVREVVNLIPTAWQYPEITCARLLLENHEVITENFEETIWKQTSDILVKNEVHGIIEVFYLEEKPEHDEGPFLDEERNLIDGIARNLGEYIERQQALRAMRESENQVRLLLNSTAEAIYGLDMDGNCTFANRACIQILGYKTTDEPIGQNMHDLIHHSYLDATSYPVQKCPMFQSFQKGEYTHIDNEVFWRADGTNFEVEYWSYPIIEDDQIKGAVVTFMDISERKKLENQLRQAQKMEAIGTLTGGIAHDFNNILTTIIGNASLALMEVGKDGPLREEIEEIQIAGERAASLTRQLLAFSRKQIVQPKVLDLNELLAGIEKMLVRLIGEDVEFLTIHEPVLWKAKTDPGQMEQVIMNLVVNARDAMPKGGKLTVETANVDLDENYGREHGIEEQPGSYVMMAVSDTGSGIDKETQEHIFEPFYTTKEQGKGTGLGLSTVYGVVKQNNGFIWVYSEPGQGTTFKVYLPEAKGSVASDRKEQTPVLELDGSETVLIVEDDSSLRNFAQKALQQHGYRVLAAESGEDALRVSEDHEGSIQLMITDVVMPKISGKETADQLQPHYPHMKVIYMSGYTDNAIVHHGVLAPGLNFIEKPFSPEALARKVREVLNKAKVSAHD